MELDFAFPTTADFPFTVTVIMYVVDAFVPRRRGWMNLEVPIETSTDLRDALKLVLSTPSKLALVEVRVAITAPPTLFLLTVSKGERIGFS